MHMHMPVPVPVHMHMPVPVPVLCLCVHAQVAGRLGRGRAHRSMYMAVVVETRCM